MENSNYQLTPDDVFNSIGEYLSHLGRLSLTGEIRSIGTKGRTIWLKLDDLNCLGFGSISARLLQLSSNNLSRLQGCVATLSGELRITKVGIQFVISAIHELDSTQNTLQNDKKYLAKKGVFEAQKTLELPLAPVRVGVVAPVGNGYKDVVYIFSNSKYDITTSHYPASSSSLPHTIAAIKALKDNDIILLTRGGGDLSETIYNDASLAIAIAESPTPVITGVGHSADLFLVDEAAALSFPTPTAAAQWVVRRLEELDSKLQQLAAPLKKKFPEVQPTIITGRITNSLIAQIEELALNVGITPTEQAQVLQEILSVRGKLTKYFDTAI